MVGIEQIAKKMMDKKHRGNLSTQRRRGWRACIKSARMLLWYRWKRWNRDQNTSLMQISMCSTQCLLNLP